LIATAITDLSGDYAFSHLAQGTYYVYVTKRIGTFQPTGKSLTYYQVKLATGAAFAHANFGEEPK